MPRELKDAASCSRLELRRAVEPKKAVRRPKITTTAKVVRPKKVEDERSLEQDSVKVAARTKELEAIDAEFKGRVTKAVRQWKAKTTEKVEAANVTATADVARVPDGGQCHG